MASRAPETHATDPRNPRRPHRHAPHPGRRRSLTSDRRPRGGDRHHRWLRQDGEGIGPHPVACPTDQVLLGRAHFGDENGETTYYCGLILIDGQRVKVGAPSWSEAQRESNSFFAAPQNEVLVGRQHSGDENGPTRYATASLSAWGRTVELTSYRWTPGQREGSSHSKAGDYEVMVGRQHSGDENGQTGYQYARIAG
ncbi:hypothetical protein [Nonomuraea sp. NPDC049129]|uniref:hypothetical protein n=1 Tax=Nonomuraea sp. NPDC049129 TaxID=3155272 RepID=UPI0033C8D3E1